MNYHQSVSAQNLRSVIGILANDPMGNTDIIEKIEIVGFGEDGAIQIAFIHFKNSEVKVSLGLYEDEFSSFASICFETFTESNDKLRYDHVECAQELSEICEEKGYHVFTTKTVGLFEHEAMITAREDVFPLTA
jgi:hypothetical protein